MSVQNTKPNTFSALKLNWAPGDATKDICRFLEFSLGKDQFAIPLLSVKEVIAYPEITPIPFSAPHFLGIMNLRGQILSVIDLRLKFNIKEEKKAETSVVICDFDPLLFGMVVSSVDNVLALTPEEILPPPEIQNSGKAHLLGVAKRNDSLTLLLDIPKILNLQERNALKIKT